MKTKFGKILMSLMVLSLITACGEETKRKSQNINTRGNDYRGGTGLPPTTTTPPNQNCTDPMADCAWRVLNPQNSQSYFGFLSADLKRDQYDSVNPIQAAALLLKIAPNEGGTYTSMPNNATIGSQTTPVTDPMKNHIRFVIWDAWAGKKTDPSTGRPYDPIQIDLPPNQPSGNTYIYGTITNKTDVTLNYQDEYGSVRILGTIIGGTTLRVNSIHYKNLQNQDGGAPAEGDLGFPGGPYDFGIGPSLPH